MSIRSLCSPLLLAILVTFAASSTRADDQKILSNLIELVSKETADSYLAAQAIGRLGEKAAEAKPALGKALQSKDARLRIASALALVRIVPQDKEALRLAVRALVEALTDSDPDVRREALRGIARVPAGSPEQVKAIAEALTDNDDFVAAHAADALIEVGERSVPVLIEATRYPKSVMWALLALAEIGEKASSAQDAIIALLSHEDPIVRQEAALALAAIKPDAKKAVAALMPLLDDKVVIVRAAAGYALGEQGAAAAPAAAKFKEMLKSEDKLLRLIAARGLVFTVAPRGAAAMPLVAILREGLSDERVAVRRGSLVALTRMVVDARAALPDVQKLLEDKDESVRQAAAEAVKAISGK